MKPGLIFFVTEMNCPENVAVASTLAWVAKKQKMAFDAYVCAPNPHSGYWQQEQFYFTSNFYDLHYCSITRHMPRFKRASQLFGGVISSRRSGEIADFYEEVFTRFDDKVPSLAVIMPTSAEEKKTLDLAPFCYPEIYHRQCLGVNSDTSDNQFVKLRELGVKEAYTSYCSEETIRRLENLDFKVNSIDELSEGDTYGSVTSRIAERWLDRSRGVGFASPIVALKWLPFYLRDQWVTVFEPNDCVEFCHTIAKYANKIGNKIIWGSQAGSSLRDHLITELSRHDLVMGLCYAIEVPSTTIKREIQLPLDWLEKAKAPWEEEYGEVFLNEKAEKGGIAVSILMYGADLGHHAVLPRILDLMAEPSFRAGIAFPSTWWEYESEVLEDIFMPQELGGVFPRLEPLLSSAGVGVATEARGFLKRNTLVSLLKEARRTIGKLFGDRMVPIGYYPWEDACPYYIHSIGEPQFDALIEAGIKYCVSYMHEGTEPRIVFKEGGFMAINQQVRHWTTEPISEIKSWEGKLVSEGKPGWVIVAIDVPFWGEPIRYLNPRALTNLGKLYAAMAYAAEGGESKRLFLSKPHEVARFAEVLDARGILPPQPPPMPTFWML